VVSPDGSERDRGVDEALPTKWKPNRHYLGWLANEAKAQFGCPTKCEANFIMVRRWVLTKMQGRNMRPQHITRWLPTIVAYVFVPTEYELEAREYLMSEYVRKKDERYTHPYTYLDGERCPEPFPEDS